MIWILVIAWAVCTGWAIDAVASAVAWAAGERG